MTDSGDTQSSDSTRQKTNFLREIIENDLASGRYDQIVTRFPPEPNGHLHIGHARNIYLNFHLPEVYGGRCHLRMDDTNPEKEKQEYVDNIIKDIRWLGFDWGDHFYLASNYFDRLYACAEALIEKGMAYVCFQSEEDMRESRGTVSEAGTPSPWRDTDPALNLERFRGMRDGQYADGECVLRGKIDMAAANMKLRDPPLYRIRRQTHQHTGDRWCIYPMYDFAHPLSDAFEHITHSICTLEFQDNRAIYDWLVEHCPVEATPHQYEVSRANLNYTVMSKRILARLVDENQVDGWDDPRMPTLSGFRRRGVRPEAIRTFCERSGISKSESTVEMDMLEHLIRDDLNHEAPRVMAVLNPLKVTITNWERDTDWIEGSLWPHDVPKDGVRPLPFSRNILIERTDFAEIPPKKWRRLAPGWEVRLRYGYVIRCDEVIRDGDEVVELRCSYDSSTRGGNTDRKVKGTIHWVSADHALDAEVRLYERLFSTPFPGAKSEDLLSDVNPQSKQVIQAKVEPAVADLAPGRFQFERQGYFFTDPIDNRAEALVFNLTVGLRNSWAKKKPEAAPTPVTEAKTPSSENKTSKRPTERKLSRSTNPVLQENFERYTGDLAIPAALAEVLADTEDIATFFNAVVATGADAQTSAKWLVNDLIGALEGSALADMRFGPVEFGALMELVQSDKLSSRLAKKVLQTLVKEGGNPADIVAASGMSQISDTDTLKAHIDTVLAANPDHVARFKAGNERLIGFFVGQIMQATKGQANPKVLQQLLRSKLAE